MAAAAQQLERRYLLFHAGSVAWKAKGVLLPAPSCGGKTTLVAGLVAADFQFLGDEVAALDPDSLRLDPFPRSLCIRAGSRAALAHLYPDLALQRPDQHSDGEPAWSLTPPAEAWPPNPVSVGLLVVPEYVPERPSRVASLSRSRALAALLGQSSRPPADRPSRIESVVEMVRRADCYTLSSRTVDEGVRLLHALASQA